MDIQAGQYSKSLAVKCWQYRYQYLFLGISVALVLFLLVGSGYENKGKLKPNVEISDNSDQIRSELDSNLNINANLNFQPSEPSRAQLIDREDIRLQGVIEYDDQKLALVRINDELSLISRETDMISPGLQLEEIQADFIVVRHTTEFEKIRLEQAPAVNSEVAEVTAEVIAVSSNNEEGLVYRVDSKQLQKLPKPDGINQISDYQYVIARDYLSATVNSDDFFQQALIDPVASGGFAFSVIKPGGPFDHLGFKMGDVVSEVNGKAISTIQDALAFGVDFDTVPEFEVRILRDNEPLWLRYYIH